jgi:hypothetical protein
MSSASGSMGNCVELPVHRAILFDAAGSHYSAKNPPQRFNLIPSAFSRPKPSLLKVHRFP